MPNSFVKYFYLILYLSHSTVQWIFLVFVVALKRAVWIRDANSVVTRVLRGCDGRAVCPSAWWLLAWRGSHRDLCPRKDQPGRLRLLLAGPSQRSFGSGAQSWNLGRSHGRDAGRAACGWEVRCSSGSGGFLGGQLCRACSDEVSSPLQ